MIKRNGVSVTDIHKDNPNVALMNARTKNVALAKETLQVIKDQSYTNLLGEKVDLKDLLDDSIKNTVLYQDSEGLVDRIGLSAKLEVTNETTANAAVRLAKEGKTHLVALNFASARNQGGGFLAGAMAQEEDLCRCSGLYACLKNKPKFYNDNILKDDTLYTDNIMYHPDVPFFRDSHYLFLDKPFTLSLITAPAPNRNGAANLKDDEVKEVFEKRIRKIYQVAMKHGHKNILLGAWGCGAFGNDPEMVCKAFLAGLEGTNFEFVSFPVYDYREPPVVYETFRDICK